ncbi:D-alanine--D-alanine ligase [Motilimonas sp. 1_MG-2023]|uniref:D-alanine--D-alanine ligase n=1 Tax=Motilimonas sp. 1_MG-2023 TaxID=3062672 RepID=UPI0026E2AB31|nr:D-alanine--D-alanine ligase [Motilimonas sp. 1_MG-2023]MDO6526971.1 D-alanine--D-alanine ligase [Motilimonas sp. 1_MG-2023]
MNKINVLLLSGGESSEHEVSLRSASFIAQQLSQRPEIQLQQVVISKTGQFLDSQQAPCQLNMDKQLRLSSGEAIAIDFVIPCIHGHPGETGTIQSYFELIKLPYLGCGPEANNLCFNKISSKMWFDALGVANTPSLFLTELNADTLNQVEQAFDNWGSVFIKAASQGSSVGCYAVNDKSELSDKLSQAFTFSDYVLVEKTIKARELEIAAYEYQGEVIATVPSEIICPDNTFYTYEEKYAADSHSLTQVVAQNLSAEQVAQMQAYAITVFKGMKLKHLSRIDFFLTAEGEILLNEINTFPGMTKTSMFPQMLANHGHQFSDYLWDIIKRAVPYS